MEDLPALQSGARMGWGVAISLFVQIFLAAALVVLLALTDGAPFLLPPLLFLVARIIGDLARAFAGNTPTGMAIEGHIKAIAWPVLVYGLTGALRDDGDPFAAIWTTGLALGLAGASLWGHHVHAEKVAPRLGKEEGVLGGLLATIGAPLAATLLPVPTPWDLIMPLFVFVIVAALATRAVVRLLRRREGRDRAPATGWGAWYQEHFFRLTLLVVATIAYLFIRDRLVGLVPFLFLFEYGIAVTIMGIVLWTLRNHLSKRIDEHPLASPYHRHEQQVDRQGETAFDTIEDAFGRFLDAGETDDVERLAADLEARGIPAGRALLPITSYTRQERLLLVHPAFLYSARIGAVLLAALAVRLFVAQLATGQTNAPTIVFLGLTSLGVYATQWNRFGGPWWLKPAAAGVGIFLFLLTDAAIRTIAPDDIGPVQALTGTPVGIVIVLAALGLPLLHIRRARTGKPIPRYGYAGTDPLGAIERLRQNAEATLVKRIVWAFGLGVVAFFLVGELSRLNPNLAVLFPVYLIGAVLAILQPLSVAAGLRLGATQVQRRHQREHATRRRLFDEAIMDLDRAFTTDPRRYGGPLLTDPTETR